VASIENLTSRTTQEWKGSKRNQLQFEVKGQPYFLAFVEDERKWYVFAPTPAGVRRIPVYVDGPAAGKAVMAEGNQNVLN